VLPLLLTQSLSLHHSLFRRRGVIQNNSNIAETQLILGVLVLVLFCVGRDARGPFGKIQCCRRAQSTRRERDAGLITSPSQDAGLRGTTSFCRQTRISPRASTRPASPPADWRSSATSEPHPNPPPLAGEGTPFLGVPIQVLSIWPPLMKRRSGRRLPRACRVACLVDAKHIKKPVGRDLCHVL
jgi:hypothetical protein